MFYCLHFYGASTACSALLSCLHCAEGLINIVILWHISNKHTMPMFSVFVIENDIVCTAMKMTVFTLRPICNFMELLWHYIKHYYAAMATSWWLHWTLIWKLDGGLFSSTVFPRKNIEVLWLPRPHLRAKVLRLAIAAGRCICRPCFCFYVFFFLRCRTFP